MGRRRTSRIFAVSSAEGSKGSYDEGQGRGAPSTVRGIVRVLCPMISFVEVERFLPHEAIFSFHWQSHIHRPACRQRYRARVRTAVRPRSKKITTDTSAPSYDDDDQASDLFLSRTPPILVFEKRHDTYTLLSLGRGAHIHTHIHTAGTRSCSRSPTVSALERPSGGRGKPVVCCRAGRRGP